MVGQGGPNTSRQSLARAWPVAARLTWALALALIPRPSPADAPDANADSDARPSPTLRLRIEWGGGAPRQWQGSIGASEGEVANPVALGIDADEPGSMWIESGRLLIRQPAHRAYDGVDLDVSAPLDATLHIELAPADGPSEFGSVDIPLALLVEKQHSSQLDDQKNRLEVSRAPGDKLRVTVPRDSLIYAPNENLELQIEPFRISAAAGSKLSLQAKLFDAVKHKEVGSQEQQCQVDAEGTAPPFALSMQLPEDEGVYDLVLQTSRWGLPNRLDLKHGDVERRVQLIVVRGDPRMPDSTTEPPSFPILEIDPAKPGVWDRLPKLPVVMGLRRGPLGDAAAWQHPLGTMMRLGAGGREPNISWEAYPLSIAKPGEPHIIEVEYPSDVPQVLGISVVEANSPALRLDSGVYVPQESAGGEPRLAKHRLVFWPRTKAPLLLLTNRLDGTRAAYSKLRVLGPQATAAQAVKALSRDDWDTHSMLKRRFRASDPAAGRILAAYYDRPLFPENFSATEGFDSLRGQRLDDWRTFQEGGVRLAEYLGFAGYNGVMLAVLADGSTLYPSARLQPTPRHDTGVFFSDGHDPLRKDALELLFRIFDREGLTLIPTLHFSAPLPALEAARRKSGEPGIELVGDDGQTWLARHTPRNGLAPYYNPLDDRVQTAMLDVVRELIGRYRHHPSLGGLAVQLSADGYAQLPGADWGYDEQTLARFQREAKVKLPAGEGAFARRVALLRTAQRQPWLLWRAETLARFYRRMQEEMAAERPGLKLYLAGTGLFDRPEFEQDLRPALTRSTTRNEEALLTTGIAPQFYHDAESIVLLRPQRLAPLTSLVAQGAHLELNLDPHLDRLFAQQPNPAALFFHEPQKARLPSFDAKNPFKTAATLLLAQPVPSAQYNRRRFIHAIAALDARAMFDGGAMLPLGQENELEPLLGAYRQLPDLPFQTLAGRTQPVTVRTLSHSGRTFVYFANDSPWKTSVNVEVELPADCGVRSLYASRRLPALAGDGMKRSWTIQLEAYDLVAAVFTAGGVKLSDPRVSLDAKIVAQLDARVQDLMARARALDRPAPIDRLANGNFESPPKSRDEIPGWEVNRPPSKLLRPFNRGEATGPVALDTVDPHSGKRSVRLEGGQARASLTSRVFDPPQTGWLSVSVWMRAGGGDKPPRVSLSLDGQRAGQPYHRAADLGGGQKLGAAWSQFGFDLPDLPTDLSPLRLQFTCQGGEVWIDDVELFDLEQLDNARLLTLVWLTTHRAGAMLADRKYADCLQLLDGYWPRYLTSFVPRPSEPVANHPRKRPAAAAAPAKTGVLDRMRNGLKGLWR